MIDPLPVLLIYCVERKYDPESLVIIEGPLSSLECTLTDGPHNGREVEFRGWRGVIFAGYVEMLPWPERVLAWGYEALLDTVVVEK